jgi:hypothetical protein
MKSMVLLASLGLASALLLVSADDADTASRRHHAAHARVHAHHYARTNRHGPRRYARRGGYHGKMTLNEILYGPAGMPPAPHDFGPHFDYPPESLNGGPTSSPYLH